MEWLKEIIPDSSRVVTESIDEKYLSDMLGRLKGKAAALVFVQSTEEVSRILQTAHSRGIPVTPRGAGTNLVGSTVPVDGGIILDFSLMNKLLELDRDTMTVTVEPGDPAAGSAALRRGRGILLSARPRREGLHNRRKYQHERRR